MASKKSQHQSPAAKATKGKTSTAPEGFTPERFERELKDLAVKAKQDTWSNNALGQLTIYAKVTLLLGLLGLYSNVSQLALSPVYGSIPAAVWHSKLLMVGCFLGWSCNLFLRQTLPVKTEYLLPIFAVYVPTVQYVLYQYSDALGAQWGPVVTEAATLAPLAVVTAALAADYLEDAQLTVLPAFLADSAPGLGSWALFKFSENLAARNLPGVVGHTFLATRVGLETLLAATYTIFAPSKYLLVALPALLHTAFLNPHVQTPMALASLQQSLAVENMTVIDRQESLTGYISVLESWERGFRLMRCDHSLLGGEWISIGGKPLEVRETVYGVFLMLEAVRLVETETPIADKDARALNIGLGIGTTPTALVRHGIDTTVVEIDPVVYKFAVDYFDLQTNNPPVLEDAVSYTAQLAKEAPESFDYIVHDVFTGGAEPVDLFTREFLQGLSNLLKPEGVIAINYAGDFHLPAPRVVIRTILDVFPTCRVFRESAADEDQADEQGHDFINTVIFCKKKVGSLTFRKPVEADFLRSRGRQQFLEPKHEIELAELISVDSDLDIMRQNNTDVMKKWHVTSAKGHWNIMRIVLPARVWELW